MNNKILLKIQALLSKTVENGCSESEALAAAEMATTLLLKYNLSTDDLRDDKIVQMVETTEDNKFDCAWRARLLIRCAKYNFCYALLGQKNNQVMICGSKENIKQVVFLWRFLQSQIIRLSLEEFKKYNKDFSDNLWENLETTTPLTYNAFLKEFAYGCTVRLGARLKELFEYNKKNKPDWADDNYVSNVNALVVRNTNELADYLKQHFPNIGTVNIKSAHEGDAFARGQNAANRMNLNQKSIGVKQIT